MFIMQWFGILALLFLLFALAGFVYIGANTDKLGFGFGEPSEISKQITTPITESIASPSTSDSSQSNSKNDLCSNIDSYCMDRYSMMNNPDGYNSCVQSMMYSCNPELKTQQWSDNTCSRLQGELIEIRVKKSLTPIQDITSGNDYTYNSLMQREYNVSQDILYQCK